MMRAYKVEVHDGDRAVIVHADTRGEAKKRGHNELNQGADYVDWIDLRCQLAPEFDGLYGDELLRAMLEAGWHWECGGCYTVVWGGNDQPYVLRHGAVYCSAACCLKELRAGRSRLMVEWDIIRMAVEAWPGAEVRSVWKNNHGWGASLHFQGEEYPTTRFVEADRSAA